MMSVCKDHTNPTSVVLAENYYGMVYLAESHGWSVSVKAKKSKLVYRVNSQCKIIMLKTCKRFCDQS